MSKRNQLFPSYEYLDSQRLKDTFFSPPRKKTFSKRVVFTTLTVIFLSIITILLMFNYAIILIPRKNISKNTFSLIKNKKLASVYALTKDTNLLAKRGPFLHLIIPPQEKNGIQVNLKKSINLNTNTLNLSLKKPPGTIKIGLIIKDVFYHSNARAPFIIDIADNHCPLTQIPIAFTSNLIKNTNLSKIDQITVYFYRQDTAQESWALISDLVLVKNN
ncbi:MAG: hypothetical protein ABIH71_00485 [Candidatus Omnitrophota bacterium]|nr:hypothetical protein [Candidatus Omnitrophota bacterium]